MSGFYRKLLLFALLQVCLLELVLSFNQPSENSYMYGYGLKKQLLQEAGGNRLILIGGSSVAMGIDSSVLEEATGMTPVNMGLHAGLGRRLILNSAMIDDLRPGDLVVLSLEYGAFGKMPPSEVLWQLLRIDSTAIKDLSASDVAALFETAFSYTGGQMRNAIQNIVKARRSGLPPAIYRLDGFNQYGDLTSHWELGYRRGARGISILDLESRHFDSAIRHLKTFIEDAQAKGATVVYAFPPLEKSEYENKRDSIQTLLSVLQDEIQLAIILFPEEAALDEAFFFDTAYHLNYQGVSRRSTSLAKRLQ